MSLTLVYIFKLHFELSNKSSLQKKSEILQNTCQVKTAKLWKSLDFESENMGLILKAQYKLLTFPLGANNISELSYCSFPRVLPAPPSSQISPSHMLLSPRPREQEVCCPLVCLPKARCLSLVANNILSLIILCYGDWPVHRAMVSRIPGFYSLDASSTHSSLTIKKMSPDIIKCPLV